jgi:RNA recognition motif-containing protein
MNITVENIFSTANGQDLKDAFTAIGEVSSASIIKDKFSGESRGFKFAVTLYSQASADAPEGESALFDFGRFPDF